LYFIIFVFENQSRLFAAQRSV